MKTNLLFVDKGRAKNKTHIVYLEKGEFFVHCMGKPLKETSLLQTLSATMRTEYWCKHCMKYMVKVMLKLQIEKGIFNA